MKLEVFDAMLVFTFVGLRLASIIGLTESNVHFSSGNLDRYVTGDAAVDILSACDEESTKSVLNGSPRSRTVFTKKLSNIAANIPKMPSQMSIRKAKRSRPMSPRSKRASSRAPGKEMSCTGCRNFGDSSETELRIALVFVQI